MRIRQLLVLGLLAGFLAGCSQPTIPDPDAQSSAAAGDDGMSEQEPMDDGGMDGGIDGGEFFDDEAAMTMVIYFDFDQSDLRPEYADVLARHASGLSNSSRTSIRLEGHADERGSREYNIGLGERRSQSVRRMLLIQGASSDQISTVSFGEERPAAFGSDEDSYQQNRRVEIKYTN
jgi:peptidoglycan-associated lipoprotein